MNGLHFKLDENADPRWREPLEREGHRVSTTAEEGLNGSADEVVAQICQDLDLCLISVDMGFAQILSYPPERYAGLIVLRHPRPTLKGMQDLVRQIASAVKIESPRGQLWIVEPGRIRIHWSLSR